MNGFRGACSSRPISSAARWTAAFAVTLMANQCAVSQNYLYPDMFPFVEENAPANMQTLQAWQLSGTTIKFQTMFANQGAGLFEIRKGANVNATRYELLQRVYVNSDFGPQFVDLPIGTAPIPGGIESPNPSDLNVIWFEDFTRFSLLEAPVVNGVLTVGGEVASTVKTSWRVSSNTGPLPGFASAPVYSSSDQRVQQRVSVGWADMYSAGSSGQLIDITGVPFGPRYWLRQTVDPENRIHETNEANNTAEILIDLTRPGEAVTFAGQFVQPGDLAPPAPGDLNQDGLVNRDDWLAFKAGAETNLAGLSARDAYLLGDLNSDGQHTLQDAILFRQQFDAANGPGSFASLGRVPEPATAGLAIAGSWAVFVTARRLRRRGIRPTALAFVATCAFAVSVSRQSAADVTLFSENFDALALGPNVNETVANPMAWTDTPPPGWTVNDSGVPTVGIASRGVKEWEGWSFANKNWWVQAAEDQNRSQFSLGSGTVAVADPDEWDDRGTPVNGSPALGYYNALMRTPSISLAGAPAGFVRLTFASSWRPECCDDGPSQTNDQTAVVRASFDGGPFTEIMRWSSNPSSATYKADSTNEQVTLNLNNAAASQNVALEFGLLNAGNDWWWAIDNVKVYVPTTLSVDVAAGSMSIVGATDMAGYEITSPSGGLDAAGWRAGNLDARNVGSPTPATADFNGDGAVNGADFLIWQRQVGASQPSPAQGDAEGDQDVDGGDLNLWKSQFATVVAAGDSWETLIDADSHLVEYFLTGSSSAASLPIGRGFDVAQGARDLHFFYAGSAGQMTEGPVVYSSAGAAAGVAAAEPSSSLWFLTLALSSFFCWTRLPLRGKGCP
jgi:hypothetical protein